MKYGIWMYESQCWMNDRHGYILWSEDKSLMEAQLLSVRLGFSKDGPSVQPIRHNGMPSSRGTLIKKEEGNE